MAKRIHVLTDRDRVESLLAEIDALPAARGNRRRDVVVIQTDARGAAHSVVLEAAKRRRLSIAAYVRRAAYAMAAYDLKIPLTEVLEIDSRMTRENGYAVDDPDGDKFGLWEIESIADEPHGR